MSLFPLFSAPQSREAALPLYTDVGMDYDRGVPRWENGSPVVVTGLEAVKSWAWRAVAAERYRWPIYTWDYGCELLTLVGQPYLAETKRSEAARYVREALTVFPYITAASVQEVSFDGSALHLAVEVESIYGKERIHV